ncbi:MAG TPA: ATP-binding protein [Dissulfurispiraceae bacterium]
MDTGKGQIFSVIRIIACVIAVVVAISLPSLYFIVSYRYHIAALETEAEINARIAMQIINSNPDMWRYEVDRLTELLSRRPGTHEGETRRIKDSKGTLVLEIKEHLPAPLITRSRELFDSGRVVGSIEISRSLRQLLVHTGMVSFFSLLLGFASFGILRTIPLKALEKAMSSLQQEKEKAQVTLASIGDGVIVTDGEGKISMLNAIAEKLTGWTPGEAQGRHIAGVFHCVQEATREPVESPVATVLSSGEAIRPADHAALMSRGGAERLVTYSAAPIRYRGGALAGVVLVFSDVTEQQRMQEELIKRQKIESIGLLAGGIAHDFNNILTAILGSVSLVKMKLKDRVEPAAQYLRQMENACLRARDLTRQLLTFARGGEPEKRPLHIEPLIRGAVDLALTGSNIKCKYLFKQNHLAIEADEGQIGQVLSNLVINACQAMPAGGDLRISVAAEVIGTDNHLQLPAGKYVKVAVEDQGAGIPKEQLAKVFDPYFTTKRTGRGLGLAITLSIVKKHGGAITVKSEPGVGTTFTVYLPALASGLVLRKIEETIPEGKGGSILVMDDERAVRDVAGAMLKEAGYRVAFAADGKEAIAMYREAREARSPFDAVIMDLTIPGGMGGKEAIAELCKMDPEIKAIASSGYSDDPVMANFRSYGFTAAIAKPYGSDELNKVVHRVLTREPPLQPPSPRQAPGEA